ncbi:MAG: ABC transporter permease, partial [Desulfurococcales archaeon]|nr:ABC transporter permease [Desulfurococcales archaeon]
MTEILYSVKEGLKGFARVKFMSFLTVLAVAGSLVIAGIYLLIACNLLEMIERFREKVEVEAFLEDGLTPGQIDSVRAQIEELEGVASVRFVSKEEAMERFRRDMADYPQMLEAISTNPLPASFEIKLKDNFRQATWVESVVRRLKLVKGIEDIRYARKELAIVEKWIWYLSLIGLAIGLVVIVATLLQVYNTIHQSVAQRKETIEIMWLIGAKWSYIRRPFLVEGLIYSLLAV